jgi:hypothetical protein
MGVRLLAITILTSHDDGTLDEIGVNGSVVESVRRLAQLAKEAGADGVVASPQEVEAVREACGRDFLIVTPGIRPAGAARGDQARLATPAAALAAGADYLVVGRPITEAADPADAADAIVHEMERARLEPGDGAGSPARKRTRRAPAGPEPEGHESPASCTTSPDDPKARDGSRHAELKRASRRTGPRASLDPVISGLDGRRGGCAPRVGRPFPRSRRPPVLRYAQLADDGGALRMRWPLSERTWCC